MVAEFPFAYVENVARQYSQEALAGYARGVGSGSVENILGDQRRWQSNLLVLDGLGGSCP